MRRVAGILGSFLVTSALILWLVVATVGRSALVQGRGLYGYRAGIQRLLTSRPPAPRLVAWVGDSTILGRLRPSFPQLLRPALRQAGGDGIVVAGPGFDAFVFYFLMGRILDLDPDVVVLTARLSAFHSKGDDRRFSYNDLCSFIPASRLPPAFLLPLWDRQLSPARLVLAQALAVPASQRVFYEAEGLRTLYNDAAFWERLGPPRPPLVADGRLPDALEVFDVSLSRRQPTVRMLEATVRMVTRTGRPVIVIGLPIPYEALRTRPWYDPRVYQERFDLLRVVVEEAGGRFIDLHDALPQAMLADYAGHFTEEGARRLGEVIWPEVAAALDATSRSMRQ